jgi:uncharacterized NAD-dependent epimerase/dehydratase family protein
MHPLDLQIHALELLSGRPVVAITVNHEGLGSREVIDATCAAIASQTGLPTCDPLIHGADAVLDALEPHIATHA